MLIFLVFFVSMNVLIIRTEGNIISIEINKSGSQKTCNVSKEVTVAQQSNYTFKIKSDFFIYQSFWLINGTINPILPQDNKNTQNFPSTDLSMNFQRRAGWKKNNGVKMSINFTLHLHPDPKVTKKSENWTFQFEVLENYDPWSFEKPNKSAIQEWVCHTFVKIDSSSVSITPNVGNNGTPKSHPDKAHPDKEKILLIIAVVIIVSLLFAQSSYILYKKIRSDKLINKKNDKDPVSTEEKPERNIANRAPLPLPYNEIIKNEPLPPVPVSSSPHGQPCYHYASTPHMTIDHFNECEPDPLPMEAYTNRGLETSEESITSPGIARRHMEDSFVPTYRHKASNLSDDEISNFEISRRLTQGHLMPKQSFRNKPLEHSAKEVRSPTFSRRHEGPLDRKQSFKKTAFDDVDEEVPTFARRQIEAKLAQLPPKAPCKFTINPSPVIPHKAYRPTADDSDEEITTPGLARRQIEAKLTQLQPKGVGPSKSFKKPSPVILQKQYRHAALDDSDEEIKTHGLARRPSGPVIPQKAYRPTPDDSDEEITTPGLARRQIEAKLTQLQPKGVCPSKSFKNPSPVILQKQYRHAALDDSDEEIKNLGLARRQSDAKLGQSPLKGVSFKIPKPLPRVSSSQTPPPSPPEKPTFHPARRQDPSPPSPPPPLRPKKPCILQGQETCRPQDSRQFSDDEWEYEKLQPMSKYLINCSDDIL